MPIYTPRGLKIRIDPMPAFAILARLEPRVSPFQVLKTVEAIELMPAVFSYLAAVACAYLQLGWQDVLLYVTSAGVAGGLVGAFGVRFVPGVLPVARAYSYVNGFAVLLIAISIALWWRSGIAAVVAYGAARLLSGMANGLINWVRASRAQRHVGYLLQASEFAFFSAALYHFGRLGQHADLSYTEPQDRSASTRCLERFAAEWPEVASRITYT